MEIEEERERKTERERKRERESERGRIGSEKCKIKFNTDNLID